ncbi:MAG: hypothetical protein ACREBG_30775 [Pyrinomonadaceae bacterium]
METRSGVMSAKNIYGRIEAFFRGCFVKQTIPTPPITRNSKLVTTILATAPLPNTDSFSCH